MNTYTFIDGLGLQTPSSGYSTNGTTLATALQERLLARPLCDYEVPTALNYGLVLKQLIFKASQIMKPHVTQPISYDKIIDPKLSLLPKAKYKMYTTEYRKLMGRLRRKDGYLGTGLRPVDCVVNGFVKFQKEKIDAVPRFIAGRNPMAVLVEKCFIGEWEHKYYEEHPFFPYRTCVKEKTPLEKANLIVQYYNEVPDCVILGADFSRFESGVLQFDIQLFHYFIELLYGEEQITDDYRTFMYHQLHNTITSRVGVKATCEGRVMSGDASTSIKNVFIVEMLFALALLELGVDPLGVRFINDGDDCLLFVPARISDHMIKQLPEFFAPMGKKLGFDCITPCLQDVVFCQSKLIRCAQPQPHNPEGWCLVRGPDKILADSTTSPNYGDSPNAIRRYVGNVGLGLYITEHAAPISQAYGELLCRLTNFSTSWKLDRYAFSKQDSWYWRIKHSDSIKTKLPEVTQQARLDYYLAFGITPDNQIALEQAMLRVQDNIFQSKLITKFGGAAPVDVDNGET